MALRTMLRVTAIVGTLCIAGSGVSLADIVVFDFNTLNHNANNNAVETYMNGVLSTTLGAGKTADVTWAKASKTYNGDGHVVGPTVNGKRKSLTLGTSDDAGPYNSTTDTFIHNVSGEDRFVMQFAGFRIYSVSFDYEIFPDGSCPDYTKLKCDSPSDLNWPDFKFEADDVLIFEQDGVTPGTSPGAPYTQSPSSVNERAPQFLGQSGMYYFPDGVTKLEFIDWPSTVGIDNLVITTTIPEPGSIVLLGTILLGAAGFMRRRRK
jgi:hypothetical protein